MAIKWTDQQKAAVDAPVADILITAAAGSGKTQVLTGRILRRILDGQDITRLLIVTFTEAAAAEIRGRIAKVIGEELQKKPKSSKSAHLRRQLALLPCAKISTIHSYCMGVIRENFFEADLPPSFRVADSSEAELMQLEAAEAALEKLYAEGDKDFLHFADSFSSPRSDRGALDAMLQLYKYSQSMPHPQKWIDESVLKYNINTAAEYKASGCERYLLAYAHEKLGREAQRLLSVISIFNMKETEKEAQNLKLEAENILALTSADRDTFRATINDQIFVPKFLYDNYAENKDYINDVRKSVKDSVKAILALFEKTEEECAEDIKLAYKTAKGLAVAVKRFTEDYNALKHERGVIDYDDMEHICISLLEDENGSPSQIADIQQAMFDEIYVDEYQDSNETQEYIFSLIGGARSGRHNTFTVGDMKQGIYGFRQANPALIAAKKEIFREGDNESQRKIVLSKNFRSCKGVIDFVNLIFENIMNKKTGGTEYDGDEQLRFAACYPKDYMPKAEIHMIETSKKGIDESVLADAPAAIEAEARVIAARIKELVDGEQVFDNSAGEFRRVKYSDIAILLRGNSSQPQVLRTLLDAGIPAYCEVGASYFETVEIKFLLSLLEIVDNPLNDIPLIAVMRSPIFGFNENELAAIRTFDMKSEYFFAVQKCAKGGDDLCKKCKDFLETLNKWREAVSRFSCSELIDYLLTESGYNDIVAGGANADDMTANLSLMVEKARMFEKSSFKGLYSFLNYIRSLKSRGSDSGEAHAISSTNNIVRIMTVHKSKGLEFPVVFLAGAAKRLSAASKGIPLHKKLGLGLYATDLKLRAKYQTPIRHAVSIRCAEDGASEEIRVLYVALTRAKERLIITGAVNSIDAALNEAKEGAALIGINGFEPASFMQCILSCLNPLDGEGQHEMAIIKKYNLETVPAPAPEDGGAKNAAQEVSPVDFKYGYERLLNLPSKVTVTELKRLSNMEDDASYGLFRSADPKTPAFLQREGKMSAAEVGTLIHFVMQTIPLSVNSAEDVIQHIESLVADGIITEEAAKYIPPGKILSFFTSPLGQRIKNADKVYREEAFTSMCNASVITKNPKDNDESVLLQGVIDCYFFEGDNIVLIDFKTDKVRDKEEIKKRYKTQIDAYADVLQKKYFTKIHEKIIYLFDIDDIIVYN